MKKFALITSTLLLVCLAVGAYIFVSMGNAEFWEYAIRRFERAERLTPAKPGVIVFVGSSSINFWHTLVEDMKPLEVLNRGFGGSQIAHINQYARRIVLPDRPRGVVVYAGDNDLSWPWSKSPETVRDDFKQFVDIVHSELPDTWIFYVSMKPTPLRVKDWPTLERANELIRTFIDSQNLVQFIDVGSAMLNAQGKPRPELFRWDHLHLNARGYALWTSIIKPILVQRFPTGGARAATASPRSDSGLKGSHRLSLLISPPIEQDTLRHDY